MAELVSKGLYNIHTEQVGATQLSPLERRARIARSNSPEELQTFFQGNRVLFRVDIQVGDTGYVTAIDRPTSGYSEGALLAVAARQDKIAGGAERTDLIYDYPSAVQEAYWGQVFSTLGEFTRLKNTQPQSLGSFANTTACIMGHHARATSEWGLYPEIRSTRTVSLHHDHIVFLDPQAVKAMDWDENRFNLPAERRLFDRDLRGKDPSLSSFVKALNEDTELQAFATHFDLTRDGSNQGQRPYGYETTIRYDKDSIAQTTAFLEAHFHAYDRAAAGVTDQIKARLGRRSESFFKGAIVQPAFTFFVVPIDEQNARLIISPNIVPIGGPERAGLLLQRSPDFPSLHTQEEVVAFHDKLLAK